MFLIFYIYTHLDCICDAQGSTTLQCKSDGSCICKVNSMGYKCTECIGPGYIKPGCKGKAKEQKG